MKVIDLLNKIANGEELPKSINYLTGSISYYLYDKCGAECDDRNLNNILNDEVEIIEDTPEDKKIPEKLNISNFPRHNNSLKKTAIKLNEVIDYLKKQR